MAKKPKKKATRGCGITITIPTEPIAGAAQKQASYGRFGSG